MLLMAYIHRFRLMSTLNVPMKLYENYLNVKCLILIFVVIYCNTYVTNFIYEV